MFGACESQCCYLAQRIVACGLFICFIRLHTTVWTRSAQGCLGPVEIGGLLCDNKREVKVLFSKSIGEALVVFAASKWKDEFHLIIERIPLTWSMDEIICYSSLESKEGFAAD
ncbi:Uncharacterized protein TCM_001198 [Theobroma cacao]|uniref:Uncharacterized protein n=1 Tax=Theobroma cacao TaxID=3641 RepID=A0A061DIX3_THECC|nr:Uncharacterized protein TCM_001198 [Theobroma cacao]